jgi:hypothetical protein
MTIQTEVIHTKVVEELRTRLRGALLRPGEEGYEDARAAWNLNAHQRPAVVVVAEDAGRWGPARKHVADAWREHRSRLEDGEGRGGRVVEGRDPESS